MILGASIRAQNPSATAHNYHLLHQHTSCTLPYFTDHLLTRINLFYLELAMVNFNSHFMTATKPEGL